MAAEVSSNHGNRELNLEVITNPERLDLIRRGIQDGDLEIIDRQRFAVWVRIVLESHMTNLVQNQRDLSGGEVWGYGSRFFDRFCSRPGFAAIWHRIRNAFDELFRAYIDAKTEPV